MADNMEIVLNAFETLFNKRGCFTQRYVKRQGGICAVRQ
jgi:hypothetical protein